MRYSSQLTSPYSAYHNGVMLATQKQTADLHDFFKKSGLRQVYKKHDFIIRPDESPHGVYFIAQGLVKAYDITKYEEENLLIIRKAEEIFPLIWGVTGSEHNIIYQALAPTTTYKVGRKEFIGYIADNRDAHAPLLDMTMEMYRIHSERILTLEYRTVRERIVSFLLSMAPRFGKKEVDGSILIEVPLRHQDIASSVNATRETTSREIAVLERKGLLENSQSYFVIKDPAELQKLL